MRRMYGQSMERERVKLICEMNCSFGMSDKIILLSSAWGVELETKVIRRFAKKGMGSFSRLSLIAYYSYVTSQFLVYLLCVNARYA